MVTLAYIAMGLTAMQLMIALVNLVFIQQWTEDAGTYGLVSVLIPARNEEKNISRILDDLLQQDYPQMEILVFNDQSEDATASIVQGYLSGNPSIKLLHSEGLPDGWLGKNHACHSLAMEARGDFLLFLDADVRIHKSTITRAVHFLVKHRLSMLSVFPNQLLKTFGEEITVPLMNYILLTLLPLILVRKARYVSLSAANGQFMLFQAESYHKYRPHQVLRTSLAEDIEISRYFKRNQCRVACLAGKREVQCHMYGSFANAIHGFSKNVLMFFGNSVLLSLIFWLLTTFGFLAVLFYLDPVILLLYFAGRIVTRILVAVISQQNIVKSILYVIPQQISLGITIFSALRNRTIKHYQWKGRVIT